MEAWGKEGIVPYCCLFFSPQFVCFFLVVVFFLSFILPGFSFFPVFQFHFSAQKSSFSVFRSFVRVARRRSSSFHL